MAVQEKDRLAHVEAELRDLVAKCTQLRKDRDTLRALIKVKTPLNHDPRKRAHEIQKMRDDGLTYSAIGEKLGISGGRVAQILRQEAQRERIRNWNPNGTAICVRTSWCLRNEYGVDLNDQRPDPEIIFRAEREIAQLLRTSNFGKKSAREIIRIAESYRRMGVRPKAGA